MIRYQQGFNNYFQSEAIPKIISPGHNSPQKVPHGLYAEQISGTAFTSPRHTNLHTWMYRIRPSVIHGEFSPYQLPCFAPHEKEPVKIPPVQMRWDPMPLPIHATHFLQGLFTFANNGDLRSQSGGAIHLYAANASMENCYFSNSDGEWLIVPEEGGLRFKTELGWIDVHPGEIVVIPRGIKFQALLLDENARGYICENFGNAFRLPELGVIGANALANPRDFHYPTAHFSEQKETCQWIVKFQGALWEAELHHCPLDVVAWHGNYAPYKYNLHLFNTINTVSFDHPDPSIFTVLTSPSTQPGTANLDFVIFPPRWMVADNTFRPPYFHRNIMSEFMGLIQGTYDAKENEFLPGGCSLHNCMSAHGPDYHAYEKAIKAKLKPEYYANTLAFMFESHYVWHLTNQALNATFRQKNYSACWEKLKAHFEAE